MIKLQRIWLVCLCFLLATAVIGFAPWMLRGQASATTYFTHTSVLPLNMNGGGSSVVAVQFTAGSNDAAATLQLVWSGGGVGSPTGFLTTYNTAPCTSASYFGGGSILPTTSPTVSGSSNTVTVSGVNALTSGTAYCFFFGTTTGMTNPVAGTYTVTITDTAASGDTTTVGVDYIANDVVQVNATVPPQFTMALSANVDNFGNLALNTVNYTPTGITTTVNTNAGNGFSVWVEDTNNPSALKSTASGGSIPAAATGACYDFQANKTGSHYGLAVASMTSGTINPFYVKTGTGGATGCGSGNTVGGGLAYNIFNPIASATGPVSGDAIHLNEVATISATQAAASDYTDNIILIGAASF